MCNLELAQFFLAQRALTRVLEFPDDWNDERRISVQTEFHSMNLSPAGVYRLPQRSTEKRRVGSCG
jgi:hypothetical protein